MIKSKLLTVLLLIAAISCFAIWINQLWPQLWPVKQLLIEGEYRYIDDEELVTLIKGQKHQGLLAINLQQLQTQIEKLDWVKVVEIKKVWPETLVLNLTEHQPIVAVTDGVLTRSGKLIETQIQDEYIKRLPKLEYFGGKTLAENEYLHIWNELKLIKQALIPLGANIKLLQINQLDNWQIHLSNNVTINLGRKQRLHRAERLAKVFLSIKDKQQIENLDLRYPNGLAVKWLDKNQLNT